MIYLITGMSLLFAGIGLILNEKNAKYLLSGYNTMSEEERSAFDLTSFLAFFKKFHLFLGISFLVFGLLLNYGISELAGGIFLGVYPLLAYIYFIRRSSKFQADKNTNWGKAGLYILTGTLLFVLILFGSGFRENKLVVISGEINIQGMYGEKLFQDDIESVTLTNELPEIISRTNGFSLGDINKGYFKTRGGESVKLILNSGEKPYILIVKKSGKKIYYSSKNGNDEEIFKSIKRILDKN